MNKECIHYQNNCIFFAKCCNKFFDCKRCHDENNSHEFMCDEIKCDKCKYLQQISQICKQCSISFSEYFCDKCKLLDSTPNKLIFHCDKCKICRIGKREDYIHCDRCNCCLHISYFDNHKCIDNRLKHNCAICMEYLDTSLGRILILRCGHSLHEECLTNSIYAGNYKCPLCYKSIVLMNKFNEIMDSEIALTPMPDDYKDKSVNIFCNECEKKSQTSFHILGLKCKNKECGSYNTIQI